MICAKTFLHKAQILPLSLSLTLSLSLSLALSLSLSLSRSLALSLSLSLSRSLLHPPSSFSDHRADEVKNRVVNRVCGHNRLQSQQMRVAVGLC